MTTTYDKRPRIDHRLRDAALIVVGRVEGVDEGEEESIVQVRCEDCLKGEPNSELLQVRVTRSRKHGLPDLARCKGERVVLALAPDYGPKRAKAEYVLHFSTYFPTKGKASLQVDKETSVEFKEVDVPVRNGAVRLADFASLVKRAQKVTPSREGAAEAEHEEGDIELDEMPDLGDDGGPTNAQLRK